MIQVRSARTIDLPGIAAVMQEAFSDKMRAIFSRQPEKVRTVLEAAYTGPIQRGYDGVLVAEQAGRVVGALTIEPMHYTPQENRTFEHLAVRELGLLRMLWAAFLLWLIGHRPEPDEAYIGDVCVAPDCQDEGIGQLLMAHADRWAARRRGGAPPRPPPPDAVGGRDQRAGNLRVRESRVYDHEHQVQPADAAVFRHPALVFYGKNAGGF
jgi:ribosomal protein S18 acetylase RimI-like enzyme